MRVKLYRAAGMSAAMALIRAELGPEALILSTRRVAAGVEVTAAFEPEEVAGAASPPHAAASDALAEEVGVDFDEVPGGEGRGWSVPRRRGEAGPDPASGAARLPDFVRREMEAAIRSARTPVPAAHEAARVPAGPGETRRPVTPGPARPPGQPERRQDAPTLPPWSLHEAYATAPTRRAVDADDVRDVVGTASAPRTRITERVPTPGRAAALATATVPRYAPAPAAAASTGVARRGDAGTNATSADPRQRAATLAWHGVPPPIAARLAAGPLAFALSIALPFAALDLATGAMPVLVAGPPGVGKTLTVARLAARLVLAGSKPLVVTADGRRAGATEQLAAFTRLLGLHLLVASTPAALARALARREDGGPVLIDGPGVDPFDPAQMAELSAMAATAGAATALVCPAGLDPHEAGDVGAAFRRLGASVLVANRLDVGRRLGGVLAAANAGLALAEAGVGPGVADGLVALTPDLLARRLAVVPEPIR